WTQVSYGGQTAYVYNEYISTDSTDASLSSQSGTLTIISEANVRSGPGTTYEVLGVAAVGDTLTITGYTSTNWYQVEYEGAIGYIAGNLVSAN
ncbi:MAG: SH3 domain-containing protein, partial [Oscillospiraceae bacterium]|nr:SH3 domain-containing protein [Oscillospiraceae bacterium]